MGISVKVKIVQPKEAKCQSQKIIIQPRGENGQPRDENTTHQEETNQIEIQNGQLLRLSSQTLNGNFQPEIGQENSDEDNIRKILGYH